MALAIASVVLAIVVVGGLVRAALTAQWLSVARIDVAGNARIATDEVKAALTELIGANILTVDIAAWRRRLRDLNWVEDVAIRRVFPNALIVTVTERTAVAVGRIGAAQYLIDASGDAIEEYRPSAASLDLPIVDGLTPGGDGTSDTDRKRAQVVAGLFGELRRHPDVADRLSEIDVADPANVGVILRGDRVLVRVGDEQFVERLRFYMEIAGRLRESVDDIDYVDVRYGKRVFLKPAGRDGSS
jgi:cell division protein FtsQ